MTMKSDEETDIKLETLQSSSHVILRTNQRYGRSAWTTSNNNRRKTRRRSFLESSFKLFIGDEELVVNRDHLSRHSGFIRQLLVDDPELSSCDLTNQNLDVEAVQVLLCWMGGKGLPLNCKNVTSVVDAAMKLEVPAVTRLVMDFMVAELKLRCLDDSSGDPTVRHEFFKLAHGPHFVHFSPDQVCRLLSDDRLDIHREKEVFNAAVRWLRHDWRTRKGYVVKMISCVRFGLMSDRDLLDISKDRRSVAIMEVPECQAFALYGLLYRAAQRVGSDQERIRFAPKPRFWLTEPNQLRAGQQGDCGDVNSSSPLSFDKPRTNLSHLSNLQHSFMLTLDSNDPVVKQAEASRCLAVVDMCEREQSKQSAQVAESSEASERLSICQSAIKSLSMLRLSEDPSIFIFGGLNPNVDNTEDPRVGAEVWRFSPRCNEWKLVTTMPEPRIHAGTTFLDGKVYVIGGCRPVTGGRLQPTASVWALGVDNGHWTQVESLLHSRMYHGVAACGGCVFAVGGVGQDGRLLDSVESFNPITGQWSTMDPLSGPRMCAAVGIHQKHLWVCGGFGIDDIDWQKRRLKQKPSILSIVECFCPDTNSWQRCSSLRRPQCLSALCSYLGHLCLIGGSVSAGGAMVSTPDVDVLNPLTQEWIEVSQLDWPRHGAVAIALGDHLHVIGGASTVGERSLSSVECYSANARGWVDGVSPLPRGASVGLSGVLVSARGPD